MRIWDEQKMADLVAEEARLESALADASSRMNGMYNSDAVWDDNRHSEYAKESIRHQQVTRELSDTREKISSLDEFRPVRANPAGERSPLDRFLIRGADGLTSEEQAEYLGETEHGDIPGGGGMSFTIRAATAGDAATGQELVPETVRPSVLDALSYYGGISRMAQQFRTSTGNEFRVPQHDESTVVGEVLSAQNSSVTAEDLANFGVVTFTSKTMSSKPIVITREMLQDSIIDIGSFAERRAVRRMGRGWDKEFTTGSTSKSLVGVVTASKLGATAAAVAALTYDEIHDLPYSIDRAYREGSESGEGGLMAESGGRVGWLISDSLEQLVTKLKDGDNRPIWVPSMREGAPNMLHGYPYEVSGSMDAVATGKIPILFGNFAYFGIRTVAAIEIFRFQDSRTMQKNTIEILGFSRRDSRAMGAIRSATSSPAGNRGKCDAIANITMK